MLEVKPQHNPIFVFHNAYVVMLMSWRMFGEDSAHITADVQAYKFLQMTDGIRPVWKFRKLFSQSLYFIAAKLGNWDELRDVVFSDEVWQAVCC